MSLLSGFSARWSAAVAAFRSTNLIPRESNHFDDNPVRFSRYQTFASYYDNEMYSSTNLQSAALKLRNGLYTNVRGVMNVVGRVVDLYVYYIYVGSIDMEHLTGGAIPLVTDDESIKDAARVVFKWSNWDANKELFVRNGAIFGDSAIKIVDDRQHQKVYMEVLDPCYIVDTDLDTKGNVKRVVIQYDMDEELDLSTLGSNFMGQINVVLRRKTFTYTEVITKEKFATYKNGEPFAFYTDMNGTALTEWPNEYGFVPLVLAQHNKTGLKWGANAFYKAIHKIDELNDMASLLNDQIRKVVIPILVAMGIKKKKNSDGSSDLEFSADNRDALNIAHIPKDTDLKPLVTNLDIAAVNGNMTAMGKEIENDMPILALQQIRNGSGQFTEPGVNAAFNDAIGAVNAARANYDLATVRALQMCIAIGGYNGYEGFAGYGLESYDLGDLDFSIRNRAVVSVPLSIDERITLLSSVKDMNPALQKIALKDMGYDDAAIEEVAAATEEATRNAVRGAMQGIFADTSNGGTSTPPKQVGAGQSKQQLLPAKAGA